MEICSLHDGARFDAIDHFAVAVSRPRKAKAQTHCGILFRNPDGEIELLHLAWHRNLKCEAPDERYVWVPSPLDPLLQQHLATYAQMVFDKCKDGQIPYSISMEFVGFLSDGSFRVGLDAPYGGLTCATFVLLLAESQGVSFIDFEKWGKRSSDERWQRQILQKLTEHMKQKGLTEDLALLSQQKAAIGRASRYKPEEVCAAAGQENPPHSFEAVKASASRLLNKINADWEKRSSR